MPKVSMADPPSWTLLELVRWTSGYFSRHRIESARSEAEILLAHALGIRRIDLYINYDQPLCKQELARFKSFIKRRVNREPVAYITGKKEFWSLELDVNPSVLIPRPETECLIESVLPFLDADVAVRPKYVLEMGTGSGAIILALAMERSRNRYTAMDRSVVALKTARGNARKHGLEDRIHWFCGDWFAPLKPDQNQFDLIVSNPPYIRSDDIDGLQPEIRRYEPKMALDGHADGLACIRHIIETAPRFLHGKGMLALEMGCDQKADVVAIADAVGLYSPVKIIQDYSGLDRVAVLAHS